MRIDPAKADAALALFTDVIPLTRAEPGCDFYEFYCDIEDPSIFMSVQRWVDLDALTWHATTPHGQRVGAEMPAMSAEEADIRVYVGAEVLSWPFDEETRKKL